MTRREGVVPEQIETLAERLTREIARVTRLREEYAAMRGAPQIDVEATILTMDLSVEAARAAAVSCDTAAQLSAM